MYKLNITHLQRWHRKGLVFFVQGDVGEEGCDSPIFSLLSLHQWVSVNENLNLH